MSSMTGSGDATPSWTPSYVRTARAAADEALTEATEFGDTDLTKMAIATAVRELAAEVRALRHQLTGNLPPRGGGLMWSDGRTTVFRRHRNGSGSVADPRAAGGPTGVPGLIVDRARGGRGAQAS